jgi:undecaprenyl-diphosphatase
MIGRGAPTDPKNARCGDPQPGAVHRAIAARPTPDPRSCRGRLSHLCSAERALIGEGDPLPHESAPLGLFALLAFGGLVLLIAPSIVMTGHARQFDIGLASALHAGAAGSVWHGQLVPMLAALGSLPPLLAFLMLGLGYLLWTGRTPTALFVVVAVGGGVAISTAALWLLASFNGPDAALPAISVIRTIQAAIVCLTSTALVAGEEERRATRIALLSVGIATAMAGAAGRVVAGIILPGDALMAWGLAALWSWFCFNLAGIVRECVRLAVTGE